MGVGDEGRYAFVLQNVFKFSLTHLGFVAANTSQQHLHRRFCLLLEGDAKVASPLRQTNVGCNSGLYVWCPRALAADHRRRQGVSVMCTIPTCKGRTRTASHVHSPSSRPASRIVHHDGHFLLQQRAVRPCCDWQPRALADTR